MALIQVGDKETWVDPKVVKMIEIFTLTEGSAERTGMNFGVQITIAGSEYGTLVHPNVLFADYDDALAAVNLILDAQGRVV